MRTTYLTLLPRTRAALALTIVLALGACGTLSSTVTDSGEAEAGHYRRQGNLQDEVDALAGPLVARGITPGMEVGVLLPDGSTHFYGYGVADKATGLPPLADTQFAVGSLSKCFLALMTTQLVAEGRLDWNETLVTLLPPGTALSPDARKITLLQLMTHTSGLPRQPMTLQTLDYFVRYLFTGESFYRHFTHRYMLDYLKDFTAPPHIQAEYSNVGYGLVGYALELRTGQPLDALLEHYVTGPLHLEHTGYQAQRLPGYAARARGYAGDQPKFITRGQAVPDWDFTGLMKGSAAIHSTARDLLELAAAFVRPDTSARGRALQEMLQPHTPRTGLQATIAWDRDTLDGARIESMIGLVAGYTAYMGLDVEHRSAVVVLQNSFNWSDAVGHRLLTRIARANPLPAIRADAGELRTQSAGTPYQQP